MTAKPKKRKRASRHDVVAALRRDIVAGRFTPGAMMPTRIELLQRFNAAPATLQAAMNVLIAEGFITVSASRHGTRIALAPPHLTHYKLILPPVPHSASHYYTTLTNEAERIASTGPRRIGLFEGIAGHDDFDAYRQIVEDVRLRRIRGLIFATGATEYKDTPLLTEPGMPRLAVAEDYELAGVPKLHLSVDSFFDRAAAYLRAQGKRRPAILVHSGFSPLWLEAPIRTRLHAHGLAFDPWLVQFADIKCPQSCNTFIQLVMRLPAAQRPDCLIVADDNLVDPATRALAAEPSAASRRLCIVAHANFPRPTPCHVPAVRLGFDIGALLTTALHAIDEQSEGRPVPPFREIPAVFDHELP